ncbi:MAG TPA: MBG domain-containing protein, partial [Verrucomicrobiae bacterium]
MNGQTLANSGVSGSPSLTTTATTNSSVGAYVLANTAGTLSAGNYSFNCLNGILTITAANLTVSPNNATRSYGATNPVFTGTLTGLALGDAITASYRTTAATNSLPGTYSIVPIWNDPSGRLANYVVTTNNGYLTITKAALQVMVNAATRSYGNVNPVFTASYVGFANGETSTSGTISGAPWLTTAASNTSPPGNYVITNQAGTLASSCYDFTFLNGTLNITPAALVVSANNVTRAYGTTNPSLTGSISGLQNTDVVTATYATAAIPSSPVGTYPITVTLNDPGSALANYTVTTNNGTLTITNTLGATNYVVRVTLTNPIVDLGLNGSQNYLFTDPASGLGITLTVSMTAYSSSNASPTFTGLDNYGSVGRTVHLGVQSAIGNGDGNFVDLFEGANFQARVIAADAGIATNSVRFGIADIGVRFSPRLIWSSSAGSSTNQNTGETLYPMDTNLAAMSTGDYQGSLRQADNSSPFQFSDFVDGTNFGLVLKAAFLVGTQTPLVVTADNYSRAASGTNPVFTVSYQGFTGGDTGTNNDLQGAPVLTCSADISSPTGLYVITNSLGSL